MCERCVMYIPLYKEPIPRKKNWRIKFGQLGEEVFFFSLLVLKSKLSLRQINRKKPLKFFFFFKHTPGNLHQKYEDSKKQD